MSPAPFWLGRSAARFRFKRFCAMLKLWLLSVVVLNVLFRFPREIIACAAWACHRFALRTAEVEDRLAARGVITDKLRSYFKSIRDLATEADHRAHKGQNNRIEGSHSLTRNHENIMGHFKSPRQAQRFLSAHDLINTPPADPTCVSIPENLTTPRRQPADTFDEILSKVHRRRSEGPAGERVFSGGCRHDHHFCPRVPDNG